MSRSGREHAEGFLRCYGKTENTISDNSLPATE